MNYSAVELHERFCQEALHIRNLSKSTISWYKESFNNFYKVFPISDISEMTTENIKTFLFNGKIENNWSASTFICRRKGLKSFCTWLVENNFLKENPVTPIPKPKLEKRIPKSLKKEDAQKVLEYSYYMKYSYKFEKYRNRAIIGTMIFAGLRKSEVLNLKVQNIDFDNNTIFVNQGKGAKDRLLPLNSDLKIYLKEYLKDRKRLKKESIYLFLGLKGDNQFTTTGFTKFVKKLKEKSGVDFSAHKLRHTFATLMLEGGVDLFALSKMLGHSDIKTTTIYLSASVQHMQEQIIKHPMSFGKFNRIII